MDISTFYKDYLNATPQELAPHGYVLQDLVRRYPWFSLGHLLLFKALCGLGGDASLSQSEKTAAYVYSRQKLFFLLQQSREDFEKIAEEEFFTLDLSEAAADSASSIPASSAAAAAFLALGKLQIRGKPFFLLRGLWNLYWTFRKIAPFIRAQIILEESKWLLCS